MTATENGTIDYKVELLRKSIHLCSLSISIVYYFVTRELALMILVPIALLSLIIDLVRYYSVTVSKLFYSIFGFMLREHEVNKKKKTLTGATYVLLAAALVVAVFPKAFVIPAIAVLILGDIAAALIGRKFGRHKFLAKSLEGTLAFFIVGCLVILVTPKIQNLPAEYLIGFIAVAVGAIAENVSYGWADDNLTIPITICLIMWGLYSIFLPELGLALPNVPV
jgi:dolichol kinase